MNSEKVEEIKKALQDHSTEKLKYQDGIKIKEIDFIDILTLINELESENEKLQRDYVVNAYDKLRAENKKLKDRLAELEDKIENGALKELPCKVGSSVYAVNHSKYNISGGYVSEEFVNKIHISSHTILVETTENGIWISKSYLPQDFGDIVFTIKAEAEARLKELQEQNND